IGAEQGEDLAAADLQVDALERTEARGVGLCHLAHVDDRLHGACVPVACEAAEYKHCGRRGCSLFVERHYAAATAAQSSGRTQMLRKLMGCEGSPCACSLIGASVYGV